MEISVHELEMKSDENGVIISSSLRSSHLGRALERQLFRDGEDVRGHVRVLKLRNERRVRDFADHLRDALDFNASDQDAN